MPVFSVMSANGYDINYDIMYSAIVYNHMLHD